MPEDHKSADRGAAQGRCVSSLLTLLSASYFGNDVQTVAVSRPIAVAVRGGACSSCSRTNRRSGDNGSVPSVSMSWNDN